MALSLDDTLPSPEWLHWKYGILWDGQYRDMSGKIAHVARIEPRNSAGPYVLRISDPGWNSQGPLSLVRRLSLVHRFQTHLSNHGVRTVLPLRSSGGETFLTTEHGMTIEVYPFVQGRRPARGNLSDVRLAGSEIARLHSVGFGYLDLPGEESLSMNHLAINRLRKEVREMRDSTRGKAFHVLYMKYVEETERWVEAIDSLRPGLVETGLHLDTGPQNMIIDNEGQLWFIDCNHSSRGRRVFEVCVSMYYLAPCSIAPWGQPTRYRLVDESVEASFLVGYKEVCEPTWREEESTALAIERMLMFIHGVNCWIAMGDEEAVREEFARWNEYYATLKAGLENAV